MVRCIATALMTDHLRLLGSRCERRLELCKRRFPPQQRNWGFVARSLWLTDRYLASSSKAKKRQDSDNDYDQTNDVDNTIHEGSFLFFLQQNAS